VEFHELFEGVDLNREPRSIGLGNLIQVMIRLLSVIAGAGVMIILSRSLSVNEFGQFTTILTLVSLISAALELGLTSKFLSEYHIKEQRPLVSSYFVTKSVLGILGFVAGVTYAYFFLLSNAPFDVAFVLLSTLLFTGVTSLQAISIAQSKFKIQNSILVIQSSLWLSFAFIVSLNNGGLLAFSFGFLWATVAQAIVTFFSIRPSLSLNFGVFEASRKLVRSSATLAMSGLFIAIYYRLPSLFVFSYAGAEKSSYFNIASRLIDVLQAIPAGFLASFLPNLSKLSKSQDKSALLDSWEKHFKVVFPISCLATVTLIFQAQPIVIFLFGDAYASAVPIVQWLTLGFPAIVAGWLLTPLIVVANKAKDLAFVSGGCLAFSVVISLALIPLFGLTGGITAFVCTEYLAAVLLFLRAKKAHKIVLPWLTISKALAVSLVGLSPMLLPQITEILLIQLVFDLALGFLVAFIAGMLLKLWPRGFGKTNRGASENSNP
jgi:O-antigen/teichoic acid export membrane protein